MTSHAFRSSVAVIGYAKVLTRREIAVAFDAAAEPGTDGATRFSRAHRRWTGNQPRGRRRARIRTGEAGWRVDAPEPKTSPAPADRYNVDEAVVIAEKAAATATTFSPTTRWRGLPTRRAAPTCAACVAQALRSTGDADIPLTRQRFAARARSFR